MTSQRPEYQALAPYTPNAWEEIAGGDKIDRWKQGDLLGPIPLGWIAPRGVDLVTDLEVTTEDAPLVLTSAPSGMTLAIITSQTCDVTTGGPGARHPFVQVSPVAEVPGIEANKLGALHRGEVVDLVLLAPPGRPASAPPLVADLRISLPVSKAVLVEMDPRPAFSDENGYLEFAHKLAVKVERPALHDFVTRDARSIIRDAIRKDSSTDTSWWSQVEEVLVLCLPTRLAPMDVEFIIVARGNRLGPAEADKWKRVIEQVRKGAKQHGIKVRLPLHETTRDLRASMYRSSTALDIPELRQPPDAY